MELMFDQPLVVRPKPPMKASTIAEWRLALLGTVAGHESVRPTFVLKPAELPPLPESDVRANFEQVRRLLGQGIVEPILAPQPAERGEFRDQFALWNEAPSRIETFLSRYHNQTFAAFAVVAVLLLWMI